MSRAPRPPAGDMNDYMETIDAARPRQPAGLDPTPLPEIYHGWVNVAVTERGVDTTALILDQHGTLEVACLAIDPRQVYGFLLDEWARRQPREIFFALDRVAMPDQGTTLGDVLAGWHFTRAEPKPFIIEYQHAPRIVKPIQWDNAWWNAGLMDELLANLRVATGVSGWTL